MTDSILHAADVKSPSPAQRESIEWCDLWLTHSTETGLPRVLLIGDSIVRAFYPEVENNLAGKAFVGRLSTSLFADDPMLLDQVTSVLRDISFDVIYVNNGMHGFVRSEAEYATGLAMLVDTIRQHSPNAKIILGTTTPFKDGARTADPSQPSEERVLQRNKIAADLAKQKKVELLDMYSPVVGHPEYHSDNIHFNPQGTAIQARVLADVIQKSLHP